MTTFGHEIKWIADARRSFREIKKAISEAPLVENERFVTRRPKFLITTVFFKG